MVTVVTGDYIGFKIYVGYTSYSGITVTIGNYIGFKIYLGYTGYSGKGGNSGYRERGFQDISWLQYSPCNHCNLCNQDIS